MTKKEVDITDKDLPDEKVADLFTSGLPAAIRIAVGQQLRAVIVQAIRRERLRCSGLLAEGVQYHKATKARVEGGLQAAQLAGNDQAIQQLGMQRLQIVGAIEALMGAEQIVEIEPGACETCNGMSVVPSSVRLPDGRVMPVQCPGCGGTGRRPEKPPEQPAAPNGVTL